MALEQEYKLKMNQDKTRINFDERNNKYIVNNIDIDYNIETYVMTSTVVKIYTGCAFVILN